MKKFVLLLVAAFALSLTAFGQTTYKLNKNDHNIVVSRESSDVVDADGETLQYIFDLSKKDAKQYYYFSVYLEQISNASSDSSEYVRTLLKQSYDGQTYSNVDTLDYYAVGADTTVVFSDLSTGTAVRFLQIEITGDSTLSVGMDKFYARFLDK